MSKQELKNTIENLPEDILEISSEKINENINKEKIQDEKSKLLDVFDDIDIF